MGPVLRAELKLKKHNFTLEQCILFCALVSVLLILTTMVDVEAQRSHNTSLLFRLQQRRIFSAR